MNACPKCDGRGHLKGWFIACARGGHAPIVGELGPSDPCIACDGTGKVSDERFADIRAGAAAREDRVHVRHRTQRQEGAALGWTAQEVARWENYGLRPDAVRAR